MKKKDFIRLAAPSDYETLLDEYVKLHSRNKSLWRKYQKSVVKLKAARELLAARNIPEALSSLSQENEALRIGENRARALLRDVAYGVTLCMKEAGIKYDKCNLLSSLGEILIKIRESENKQNHEDNRHLQER